MMALCRISAALAALLAPMLGQAPAPQQRAPQDPDLTLHVSVNLIQVDAVVTDSKGRHVPDLKAEDFEILQDGRPQKITHFSYISVQPAAQPAPVTPRPDRTAPPAPPVRLRPEQVRRTVALVVDDLGLSFETMAQVRGALKKFVDEQMQPGDLAAVIRTGGGIAAFEQFTSDKRLLHAAVERVRWNPLGRGGINPFPPFSDDDSDQAADPAAIPSASDGDLEQFREEYFSVGTLGAVNLIVRALRDLPGRKSVVLFSDNLRIFNRDGHSDRVFESLRLLTDLANRASVVIYTIDARGLPTLSLTAQDRVGGTRGDRMAERLLARRANYFDSQEGLSYLAEQTGGFFVHNTNDISGGVRQVLEDQESYYLIGYNPAPATFDERTGRRLFHKITVKVKRPGLRVRSRTGFYGTPDREDRPAVRNREQQLLAALMSPFASGGMRLKLTSMFVNSPKAGSFVRSMLHIDGHDVNFTSEPDGWHKAVLDILVVTFGENSAEVDRSSRTFTIRVREDEYRKAQENGFIYSVNHPVKKAGAYQLRTAVRDARTDKVGAASQFIEIPDLGKGRLAVSGIAVRARAANERTSDDAAAAEGQAQEEDPQGNPAVRLFRFGREVTYVFQILNAQVDRGTGRPQLQTQLRLFRDGRPVYTGKLAAFDPGPQNDAKHLLAGGRLRLGKPLTPGDYVLQVLVTDQLAKEKFHTASQWVDFALIP